MRLTIFAAALLFAGTPAIAAPAAKEPAAAAAPAKDKEASARKKPDFDMAQVMAMFDKIFPAQPDPLPQRLALARTAVRGLFPDGTYARMMGGMMHGVIDRVMGLSPADLGAKAAKGKPAETMTLRQKLAKDDPHFEERMRVTERVVGEELTKIAAVIEPRLREGLARSMARRFDEKQLADINAFLATDSGRAFGSQSMAMWIDPDVVRSMITSFPEIMTAMPGAMKRVETETAHLPKPKKAEKPAKSDKPAT
jgi:hypothetical protein